MAEEAGNVVAAAPNEEEEEEEEDDDRREERRWAESFAEAWTRVRKKGLEEAKGCRSSIKNWENVRPRNCYATPRTLFDPTTTRTSYQHQSAM